jgi:hypothetical protein
VPDRRGDMSHRIVEFTLGITLAVVTAAWGYLLIWGIVRVLN